MWLSGIAIVAVILAILPLLSWSVWRALRIWKVEEDGEQRMPSVRSAALAALVGQGLASTYLVAIGVALGASGPLSWQQLVTVAIAALYLLSVLVAISSVVVRE